MTPQTGSLPHEHHGAGFYVFIFALLILLTGLTFWTGHLNLGRVNLLLAMTIATTKATLVVLFFMHLLEHRGTSAVIFAVSLFFVLLLMLGIFGDVLTRWRATFPPEAHRSHFEPTSLAPP